MRISDWSSDVCSSDLSGGELSRISLAIEVAALGHDAVPTMVFDEVDSGIGGATAEIVGQKLRALGESRQVLCVTHLPQVAARSEEHTSELQSLMRISYAVFCLTKKTNNTYKCR